MAHLIDSWLLYDGQQRIPPFVALQASHLTKAQQKVRQKMRAVMMLVKRHGQKKECWVGDQPQSWYHTNTRKLWEIIKDEFKESYYTIQSSGLRKRAGQVRQKQIVKAKKNRHKKTCWSTVYRNCSAAGLFKET